MASMKTMGLSQYTNVPAHVAGHALDIEWIANAPLIGEPTIPWRSLP